MATRKLGINDYLNLSRKAHAAGDTELGNALRAKAFTCGKGSKPMLPEAKKRRRAYLSKMKGWL